MASARLKKKASEKFLSPEQTRTIKPADFKNHMKLKDLSQDDLVELLCMMEAELQAKDILLKSILCGKPGVALPLSQLLNDSSSAEVVNEQPVNENLGADEEDEIWLGEPSAHLNHVVAYHQVVREQMQSIVVSLEKQHKQVVNQLEDERQKHAADTAQGDDVTYMLEKEKEKLQRQIEMEHDKYGKLEIERDELLKIIEKDRHEQYNSFSSLMNDCKAFASLVVQQQNKIDQSQKDIAKEKQKNKALSELMVEETKKFKERLKLYEDEVNDFHVLEKKRSDLEELLASSQKETRDLFRQLNEERYKNSKLQHQLNQIRKQLPPELNSEYDENSEEDILLYQEQVSVVPIKEAQRSSIHLTNNNDRDSPEPPVLPPAVQLKHGKVATVQKSSTVRQSPQAKVAQGGIISVNINRNHPVNQQTHNPKRHSYEDKYNTDYSSDDSFKRNSYDSINFDSSQNITTPIKQHSSYEEVRSIAASPSQTPKRNSYEGDNKKYPPPAPPRRVSSLNNSDKPPIVKIPHSLQPRRSTQSSSISHTKVGSNTGDIPLMLCIVCNYGWEYNKDFGINETNRLINYVGILYIHALYTWDELTDHVNTTFERECTSYVNSQQGLDASSITSYEYFNQQWTCNDYPEVELSDLMENKDEAEMNCIFVRLKGVHENCFDNLSYSTMVSQHLIEEWIRIVNQEKRLMVTLNEEFEGRYFASCLSCWLKLYEENEGSTCSIIRIEQSENLDTLNITNMLLSRGVLQSSPQQEPSEEKFILILDMDYLESEGLTSMIYDWLFTSVERRKKISFHNRYLYMNGETDTLLSDDVIVIAYVTNKKVQDLSQSTYRLFKVITLPSILPGLVHRWLCQKLIEYTPKYIISCDMMKTISWLFGVYQNLQKGLTKIALADKVPEVNTYLRAPLDDESHLLLVALDIYHGLKLVITGGFELRTCCELPTVTILHWITSIWKQTVVPSVTESVYHRAAAATSSQKTMLLKATLKTLFDKSVRPGCPVDLDL